MSACQSNACCGRLATPIIVEADHSAWSASRGSPVLVAEGLVEQGEDGSVQTCPNNQVHSSLLSGWLLGTLSESIAESDR